MTQFHSHESGNLSEDFLLKYFSNYLFISTKMAHKKQTACKGLAGKPKLATLGDKPDKKDGNGGNGDDGKSKGKPGKLKLDPSLRPGLKKGSKKRKGIPMKRSERILFEVREARKQVSLCIPHLPLTR